MLRSITINSFDYYTLYSIVSFSFQCPYKLSISTGHMSNRNGLIKCIRILIFAQSVISLMAVTVIRDNANLTSVPQDIDVTVITLSLQYNNFSNINNESFPLYPRLQKLFMSHNPLTAIISGTFDHNPKLRTFVCDFCALHIFPLDFGPASKSLGKFDLIFGIGNISAFRQMRLERFTNLKRLGLYGAKTADVNMITFPQSITNLGLGEMKLITFPNLTLELFPNLKSVRLEKNAFQEGSNFLGMTETVEALYIKSSNVHCADGLDLLPNLAILEIQKNKLETLPDLLELLNIRKLYINGNSRMSCDHRMCWRRLWNRVRKPIPDSDDVTCVEPPLLTGQVLSVVNPKFMHCRSGKLYHNRLSNNTTDHQYLWQRQAIYWYFISRFKHISEASVLTQLFDC